MSLMQYIRLVFITLIANFIFLSHFAYSDAIPTSVKPIQADSVAELEQIFAQMKYQWPIKAHSKIPLLILESLPSDISSISQVKRKKALFIRVLLPIILIENRRLRELRQLSRMAIHHTLVYQEDPLNQWLNNIGQGFSLKSNSWRQDPKQLFQHLDELPTSLVLAQAIIESGWGTSRFAREGNSLFGQWTYKKGDGLTPKQRDSGKVHQVKAFPSLQASVRSYLQNINRHRAYRELRSTRAKLRAAKQPLTAHELAHGLSNYSQRGKAYINELLQIIKSTSLHHIDSAVLAEST